MERKKKQSAKWIMLTIIVVFLCGIAVVYATGDRKDRVQDLLDLGQAYLEDGEYDQAIAAYEALLEIDPKEIRSQESRQILEDTDTIMGWIADVYLAWADHDLDEKGYESAILLLQEGWEKTKDDRLRQKWLDVYLAWANMEIEDENYDHAQEILEKGLEEADEKQFRKKFKKSLRKLYQLQYPNGEGASATVTLEGTIIDNREEYNSQWEAYKNQYGRSSVLVVAYGVRFPESVPSRIDGNEISIAEAEIYSNDEEIRALLYGSDMKNRSLKMKGYFEIRDESEQSDLVSDESERMIYNPNGGYDFCVTEIVE